MWAYIRSTTWVRHWVFLAGRWGFDASRMVFWRLVYRRKELATSRCLMRLLR